MDIVSIIGISCLASLATTAITFGILNCDSCKAVKQLEDYFLNEVIQKP